MNFKLITANKCFIIKLIVIHKLKFHIKLYLKTDIDEFQNQSQISQNASKYLKIILLKT